MMEQNGAMKDSWKEVGLVCWGGSERGCILGAEIYKPRRGYTREMPHWEESQVPYPRSWKNLGMFMKTKETERQTWCEFGEGGEWREE